MRPIANLTHYRRGLGAYRVERRADSSEGVHEWVTFGSLSLKRFTGSTAPYEELP
jgi:hypothetical protein